MNEIVNKFLLAGDKFMPEMHLIQYVFTYSACGSFTKNKERMQKLKEIGDSPYTYQNEQDKACFQHDMAYVSFKDLTRRTASDKILRDKAFNIAKNPKYDGYHRRLALMIYKCFDKKTSGSGIKNKNILNKELAEGLLKLIIKKSDKREVHSSFIVNFWGGELDDMQLITNSIKEFVFYSVLLIFLVNTYGLFL